MYNFWCIFSFRVGNDGGLGLVDPGLGMRDWAQSPIPNPQSPIPNPQTKYIQNLIYLI